MYLFHTEQSMATLVLSTRIGAPTAVCFDLSRSVDLHLESMVRSHERAVGGVTAGLMCLGEEVSWEARHFGLLWRMTSRITEYEPPDRFVDEMVSGPFARFRHEHVFQAAGADTLMIDTVEFAMPLGVVITQPAGLYLRRLLRLRNSLIKTTAECG